MSIIFGTCQISFENNDELAFSLDARLDVIRTFIDSNSSELMLVRFVSGFPFKRFTIHADRMAGKQEMSDSA
jgi:hypothetical protein